MGFHGLFLLDIFHIARKLWPICLLKMVKKSSARVAGLKDHQGHVGRATSPPNDFDGYRGRFFFDQPGLRIPSGKTYKKRWKITIFHGKIHYKWGFSYS